MSDPRTLADALIEAERSRTPIVPYTRRLPFLDADTGYKAQALFVGHRLQAGELVGTAAGGAVMGDPAAAVAWLVNTLAAQGEHLPAGSVVLSGGLTASVALRPGENVVAEFDGLGSVEVLC